MKSTLGCVALLLFVVPVVVFGQTPLTKQISLEFEGNKAFSNTELLTVTEKCLGGDSGWNVYHNPKTLDYCLSRLQLFLFSKGYLNGSVSKLREEEPANGSRIVIRVIDGPLFRLGKVEVKGSKVLLPTQILNLLDIKSGEVADGERLSAWLFERVKQVYDNLGYIKYGAELTPTFQVKNERDEGIVDVEAIVDEGTQFTVGLIKFTGNENVAEENLRRTMLLRKGDVFNKERFGESLKLINGIGQFEAIDIDKDVDYRCDQKNPRLDLTVHLRRKP